MLGLETADDGLDGGPAVQLALDLRYRPSLLAAEENHELVIGRRVVAAVALVGEDACDGAASPADGTLDHGHTAPWLVSSHSTTAPRR